MAEPLPTVRVEDAAMVPSGGPARIAISDLPRSTEVADAVSAARGVSHRVQGRLVVTAAPARLVDAAGRVGGAPLADLLRSAVEPAIAAWLAPPGDLRTGGEDLPTSQRTILLGVLNVTPDSFSDGGERLGADGSPDGAVAAGLELREAGADVIDVGGESTRPGADPVAEDVEITRVVPVIERLAAEGCVVSVDTSKAAVARAAVDAGATIVNDVTAGTADDAMLETVAELGVGYVVMHLRGTPKTMQDDPRYDDVVGEVFDHLATRVARAIDAGVDAERIAIDPGIGFGKTMEHNLTLLRRTRELTSLGRPVLIGASRKGFLGELTRVTTPAERLEGSIAAAVMAVANGATMVRVHDVEATARAVAVADAIVRA